MHQIKLLTAGDAGLFSNVSPDLFDNPISEKLAQEFLADHRHHIAVAIEDNQVIAFASAVHYIHPDKPAQLFINEVAVAPAYRQHGIGKAVVVALLQLAEDLNCTEAWVLTDRANTPAMRLYSSAGGQPSNHVMFTFPIASKTPKRPPPHP